jgi:MFS family permease
VYLAVLHTSHGWPTTLISTAVTIYYLCSATWIMLVGDAIDRFGARRVVLVGTLAMGAGVLALTLARAPWQIYPGFLVMSVGWACMSGAAVNAIVAPWFDARRGLAISLALNGSSCSGMLVTPLLVALTTRLGFARGLLVAVVGMLVVMIPVLIVLGPRADSFADDARVPRIARRRLLSDPAFRTLAIPFAMGLMAQVGFLTHQIAYLLTYVGPQAAAWLVSLTTTAALVGRTVTGFFIDRTDRRVVSSANFGLQIIGLGILLSAESVVFVALGCLLFGLGVGNLVTLPSLIVQHEFPRSAFSTVVSLVVGLNQFVFAFGPAILGALRDWSGDYRASLAFCMALQTLAALIVLRGRRPASTSAPAT